MVSSQIIAAAIVFGPLVLGYKWEHSSSRILKPDVTIDSLPQWRPHHHHLHPPPPHEPREHHLHRNGRLSHLPGGWRHPSDLSRPGPGQYVIEDDVGLQHVYWFTDFPKPLTFGITVAEGHPERTLLLLPRMEALAKTYRLADTTSLSQRLRLFGMRWESDDGTNVTTAAGVVVDDGAQSPSPQDMLIYHSRSGPYIMMHRYGPHIELDQVYGLIYGKIFPRHGLQNRTRDNDDDDEYDAHQEEEVTDVVGDDGEEPEKTSSSIETTEDDDDGFESVSRRMIPPPPADPILEEYGMVPSTAVSWSYDLVTVCYVPIAAIPPDVEVSFPSSIGTHALTEEYIVVQS